MKIFARTIVVACIVPLLSGSTHIAQRDPVGCYFATPPFGVTNDKSATDTMRAVFVLEANGNLRTQQQSQAARTFGGWIMRGDSLHAWYSNGFTGWSYALAPTTSGWQGTAQYNSDEFVSDETARPARRQATLIRRACS